MNYRMNEVRLQRPVFMQFLRLFSFTFHPNLCVLNEKQRGERWGGQLSGQGLTKVHKGDCHMQRGILMGSEGNFNTSENCG